jgi:hypothetical protein
MQRSVTVEEIDLEKISISALIKQEASLKRVKREVNGALEICKNNCGDCLGSKIKKIRENYYLRGNTCAVGYFIGEEASRYVKNGSENPELTKAIAYVNIASLNYPDDVRPSLENLKKQLESVQ